MKRGLVIFIIVLIVVVLLGIVLMSLFKSEESVKSKQDVEETQLGPVVAGGVVKGVTVFDGRIMKVTEITNSSSGISNDRVEFTDFETNEVYKATLTSEGIGTVSVKGLSYNVKYFGSSFSPKEDRFVIVSSFDGSREQRVFYNAYVLFFAKGVASEPVPTVYCGNGIKDRGEQCDDGNKVSGDGCSSVCTLEQAGAGGGMILKVVAITNQTGTSNDKVVLEDIKTGIRYDGVVIRDGLTTLVISGKSYTIKYFGTSSDDKNYIEVEAVDPLYLPNERILSQRAFRGSSIIMGNPDWNGVIARVTTITNSTTGISNDKVELTDFKTGNVYPAVMTADGVGTISIGGKAYTIRYFGISSSDDNYIEIESASFGPYRAFYKSFVVLPELGPIVAGEVVKLSCVDSDKGKNAAVFGIVNVTNKTGKFSYPDICDSFTSLQEYFCSGNMSNSTIIKCPKKCSARACI